MEKSASYARLPFTIAGMRLALSENEYPQRQFVL